MQVYFINMERHTEDREKFLAANADIVDCQRFEAVDGSKLRESDLMTEGIVAEPLKLFTARSYGSALSHRGLWKKCIELNEPITVAEDDAFFNKHFTTKAKELIAKLPEDWDIIRWGYNADSILDVQSIPGVKDCLMQLNPDPLQEKIADFQEAEYDVLPMRLNRAFGIFCYTISPKGAEEFDKACFPLRNVTFYVRGLNRTILNATLDATMSNFYPQLKAYACFPPLVWSENIKRNS